MKLLTALIIALALFVRSDPLCAASQTPIAASATECGGLETEQDGLHHDGEKMAGACHACLFARLDTPTAAQPLPWPTLLPVMLLSMNTDAGGAEPPTPPPRAMR